MKQYTFYPNQGQQILARILLTIWLPVMCSPEITVAVPQSGNSRSEISTDWVSVDLTPSSSSGRQGEHQQARNIAAENKLRIAAAQGGKEIHRSFGHRIAYGQWMPACLRRHDNVW